MSFGPRFPVFLRFFTKIYDIHLAIQSLTDKEREEVMLSMIKSTNESCNFVDL